MFNFLTALKSKRISTGKPSRKNILTFYKPIIDTHISSSYRRIHPMDFDRGGILACMLLKFSESGTFLNIRSKMPNTFAK